MLHEFYTKQNAKKPKSVHATYLLTGRKRDLENVNGNGINGKDGDDSFMHSSPYMSSMPEPEEPEDEAIEMCITLVREEELEGKAHLWSGVRDPWLKTLVFRNKVGVRDYHVPARIQSGARTNRGSHSISRKTMD
jgi:hypothetical protein